MAMSSKRILMVGVALCALSACDTTKPIGSADVAFGEAVKYDNAIQIINPNPVYPPNAVQPGSAGDKGAAAVKRYRTDTVKAVETMQTSNETAGSGSSSGSTPH
jgi:hypothetical protein